PTTRSIRSTFHQRILSGTWATDRPHGDPKDLPLPLREGAGGRGQGEWCRIPSPQPPPARGGGAFLVTFTFLLQVAVGGLLMGLIYALVAAGLSLIFGLMDVVNFAHGELLMLAMYATFVVWLATGLDPLFLLMPVALALFALGVAIYHLLMARALSVRFNRGMVQIFVTFGLAIFLRGAAQFAFGSDFKSVSTSLLANRSLNLAGVFIPLPQLAAGIVSLLAFGALLLVSRTEFGRALEATREDREAVA